MVKVISFTFDDIIFSDYIFITGLALDCLELVCVSHLLGSFEVAVFVVSTGIATVGITWRVVINVCCYWFFLSCLALRLVLGFSVVATTGWWLSWQVVVLVCYEPLSNDGKTTGNSAWGFIPSGRVGRLQLSASEVTFRVSVEALEGVRLNLLGLIVNTLRLDLLMLS